MFVKANTMIIRAITPIHAGNGRALGLIDMPIQKEKHTGIPKIEASSLKGSLRELCSIQDNKNLNVDIIFGPKNGNESAGLVGFTDAKLLLYPIISINTLFSYVTCPYLINKFLEDIELCNLKIDGQRSDSSYESTSIQENISNVSQISEGECVLLKENNKGGESVILAEYEFRIDKHDEYDEIKKLITDYNINLKSEMDVVMISDTDFIEMLNLNRDIITRNKIEHETGTVADSGPFTEEYLPTESILYFLTLKNGIKEDEDNKNMYQNYLNSFPTIVQIAGNATIGKGIVEVSEFKKEDKKDGENNNERGKKYK